MLVYLYFLFSSSPQLSMSESGGLGSPSESNSLRLKVSSKDPKGPGDPLTVCRR